MRAYLYSIVRNKCLNFLKHQTVKSNYSKEQLYLAENDDFFVRLVINEEINRILTSAMNDMAPKCRKIFTLSLSGKSNQEIADQLNISINTVKTQKKISYSIVKKHISIIVLLLTQNL